MENNQFVITAVILVCICAVVIFAIEPVVRLVWRKNFRGKRLKDWLVTVISFTLGYLLFLFLYFIYQLF